MESTETASSGPLSPGDDFTFFQAGAALLKRALAGHSERIPVYGQMHEFVAAQAGIPAPTFYTDPETMVRAMLEALSASQQPSRRGRGQRTTRYAARRTADWIRNRCRRSASGS